MNKDKAQIKRKSKLKRILKIIGVSLACIIVLPIIALFAARGVNYIGHRLPNGVQEKIYVRLGGVEQFINIRGESAENSVVIWLHGGPGNADTFLTTTFQRELEADYTFIRWDQRGCGRTYYKSKDAPLSWENMLTDIDDLVDYATERFNQPVIIVGHSWGSALGSTYTAAHPEKIAGYVGIGQMTDSHESERLAAEAAAEMARSTGNEQDAEDIMALYRDYATAGFTSQDFNMDGFMKFRQLTARYLSPDDKNPLFTALFSPDYGWNDLRWNLRLMTDTAWFFDWNTPLFTAFDEFTPPYSFDVPVMLIQGENDYVCSTVLAEEYQQDLTAPMSEIFVMPGLGHTPMYDDPAAFGEVLKAALDRIL